MAKRVPSRGSEQFMLRLPDGMRDRIKDEADKAGRSMNAEIVARLETSFTEQNVTGLPPGDLKMLSNFVHTLARHLQGKSADDMMDAATAMVGGRYLWIDEGGHHLRSDSSKLLTEAVAAIHRLRTDASGSPVIDVLKPPGLESE